MYTACGKVFITILQSKFDHRRHNSRTQASTLCPKTVVLGRVFAHITYKAHVRKIPMDAKNHIIAKALRPQLLTYGYYSTKQLCSALNSRLLLVVKVLCYYYNNWLI